MTSMLALFALAASPPAEAFCGTYVGGAGAELFNSLSQVALVRQGNRTTLSMSNDVEGDFEDFAVVIPVPEVLGENDIHTLDKELFARLDQYSEPRLVRYECSDFAPENDWSDTGFANDAGAGGDGGGEGGVEVEAEYVIGEYQIVILSAEQSQGLFLWLNDNGYALPANSVDLLQQYIDQGVYFMAAQVAADAGVQPGDQLSPLQLSYDSPMFGLPIRLGTLNARESQDVIVYAVNSYADGKVGISNYPEFTVEDECLWEGERDGFGAAYGDMFTEGYEALGTEAGWTTEYAWGGSGCDPCTGNPPDGNDLATLGYTQGGWRTVSDVYFTRLHMRYTPTAAAEDLVLYHSYTQPAEQQRYIEYERYMEDRYPICGEGWSNDPGSCTDAFEDALGLDDGSAEDKGGCSAVGAAGLGLWVFGVAACGVRRRD